MRVLDLFSGLRGWSAAFYDRGHDTFTIDISNHFVADAHIDISNIDAVLGGLPWDPDIILASPPCQSFSTMSMGKMWTHNGQPKHPTAIQGRRLVYATLDLIQLLHPAYFVIENPRARLRSLPFLKHLERRTVWYCQLGETRAKPTDLWGGFPPSLQLPPECHNGNPDHTPAPRGSRTGTQGGVSTAAAGKIPYALSLLVCEAAERDLATVRAAA